MSRAWISLNPDVCVRIEHQRRKQDVRSRRGVALKLIVKITIENGRVAHEMGQFQESGALRVLVMAYHFVNPLSSDRFARVGTPIASSAC
jgi:hypothetical protein